MTTAKQRCGMWDGQQCKATSKLTACVLATQPGTILKGPEKVVVYLCSRGCDPKTEKMVGIGYGSEPICAPEDTTSSK